MRLAGVEAASALGKRVVRRLRTLTNTKNKAHVSTLAKKLWEMWLSEDKGDPRYFRGMRVVTRYVETSKDPPHACRVHRKPKKVKGKSQKPHYDKWYVGRVIGKGTLPGTYEILFDGDVENGWQYKRKPNEQHDDWHPNTPPWIGANHQGDAAITVPSGEWTWDSPWKDVLGATDEYGYDKDTGEWE